MGILMYDLTGRDDRRFSPFCWRTRMALAHKGLAVETRPTRFTEIAGICGGGQSTVPVIDDGGTVVRDSWAIAEYLDEAYPGRPSLFGGAGTKGLTGFVQNWTGSVLHLGVIGFVLTDIHDHLTPEDVGYFRENREKRFGRPLEAVVAGRDDRLEAFRKSLAPLRATLATQPWLAGERPMYADYIVFGAFQWARAISPYRLLAADDAVYRWFGRCLDLFDGLGRKAPGYDQG